MLRTGIDAIEIARVQEAVDRHGGRFLTRVYAENDLIIL